MSALEQAHDDLFGGPRRTPGASGPMPVLPPETPGQEHARLKRLLHGRWCVGCSRKPLLFRESGRWTVRCGCYPAAPNLGAAPEWMNEKEEKMNQSHEVATIEQRPAAMVRLIPQPVMSIEEYKARRDLLKYVVSTMIEDVDYGHIPGTAGSGKSLWQRGAEQLADAFQIQHDLDVIDKNEDFTALTFFYRVRCYRIIGVTQDGNPIRGACWEASAWSEEKVFTGGEGKQGMEKTMLPNNVMARAIKRAWVAMVSHETGASSLFQGVAAAGDAGPTPANPVDTGPSQWLIYCPEHGTKWRDAKDPKYSPSHVIAGKNAKDKDAWCNRDPLLNGLITTRSKAAGALLGLDEKGAARKLLDLSGGTKWSDVKVPDRVKALMAMESEADDKASELAQAAQETPAPTRPVRTFAGAEDLVKAAAAEGVDMRGLVEIVGPLAKLTDLSAAWALVEKAIGVPA